MSVLKHFVNVRISPSLNIIFNNYSRSKFIVYLRFERSRSCLRLVISIAHGNGATLSRYLEESFSLKFSKTYWY